MAILIIIKMNSKLPERQFIPVSRNEFMEISKSDQYSGVRLLRTSWM